MALCSTALQCICRVIRRSSMTMKAHTYCIIFGRPPIGGKASPFPLAAALNTTATVSQPLYRSTRVSQHFNSTSIYGRRCKHLNVRICLARLNTKLHFAYFITVLGKLFTPIVPLLQAAKLVAAFPRVARVNAGLSECKDSLTPGL